MTTGPNPWLDASPAALLAGERRMAAAARAAWAQLDEIRVQLDLIGAVRAQRAADTPEETS